MARCCAASHNYCVTQNIAEIIGVLANPFVMQTSCLLSGWTAMLHGSCKHLGRHDMRKQSALASCQQPGEIVTHDE